MPNQSEYPDDQIEHPDQGEGPPITVDVIKDAIRSVVQEAAERLVALRQERTALNLMIKAKRTVVERDIKIAVKELADAKRLANALTPRKPPTKKPK